MTHEGLFQGFLKLWSFVKYGVPYKSSPQCLGKICAIARYTEALSTLNKFQVRIKLKFQLAFQVLMTYYHNIKVYTCNELVKIESSLAMKTIGDTSREPSILMAS